MDFARVSCLDSSRNKRVFVRIEAVLRNPNDLWVRSLQGLSLFIDQEFGKAEKSFWIAVSLSESELKRAQF